MFVPLASLLTPKVVPSRFNAFTRTKEGSLIVWNSRSGFVNHFPPHLASDVRMHLSRTGGYPANQESLRSYLQSRGFLTVDAETESSGVMFQADRDHYRSDTLQLILLPTEQCNFRCTYCYESFVRGAMSPQVVAAIKLLMEKQIPKLRHFHISWFGGEPLLAYDIVDDVSAHAKQLCERHGTELTSNMTTNGSLLYPDRLDRLVQNRVTEYQITLDGPAEYHNCTRKGQDGQNTFDGIMSNLVALHRSANDCEVIVRINVDSSNVDAIPELLNLLAPMMSIDPRFRLLFRRVGEWGGENDHELKVLDERSAAVDFAALKVLAVSKGIKVGGGLLKACTAGDGVCYAARPYSFVVGSDGRLMKCTVKLDGMPENVVGYVKGDGTLHIDEARFRLWVTPPYHTDHNCKSCQLLPNCQGMHCPLIRIRDQKTCCPSDKNNLRLTLLETVL